MFYIYCITNSINGKTYIGQRKCPKNKLPETDKYMGSGTLLKRAKQKYGLENFSKKIIAIVETQENADILERVFISLYREMGKAEYNVCDGGKNGFSFEYMSDEEKEKWVRKLSESHKNPSDEIRKKMSESHKGKKHTEEQKRKISESNKGRVFTEETKRKISVANKGRVMSDDFRFKMSEINKGKVGYFKGKKFSKEHILNLSESHKDKKFSEETKRKMSDAKKGKKRKPLSEETKKKMSESIRKVFALKKECVNV